MKGILARFPRYAGIKTFIETGTFRAETIEKMSNLFSNCHSIELSLELYEKAKKKCSGLPITFHNGDSVQILKNLVPEIKEPAIFFLDAHWCGRESAKGNVDVPLLEEIKLIAKRPYNDLLIIDDFRLFAKNINENWEPIRVKIILNILREKLSFWKRIVSRVAYSVRNDRMIIPL
ncbi:MAG: hypothetical protein D3904_00900 [Candidatus Electrothrix sp. EH2]|nr:hypothetical protein [Candidatus Electrothrix sp. EH2]